MPFLTSYIMSFLRKIEPTCCTLLLIQLPFKLGCLGSPLPHSSALGQPQDQMLLEANQMISGARPLSSSKVSSGKTLVPSQHVFLNDSTDISLRVLHLAITTGILHFSRGKSWVNNFVNVIKSVFLGTSRTVSEMLHMSISDWFAALLTIAYLER